MPGKEKRKHRVPNKARLPKVVSVTDLLTRDDINGILADLDEKKPNMSDLIVIWLDKRDNTFYFLITDETLTSTATWMLEGTKLEILEEDGDDE